MNKINFKTLIEPYKEIALQTLKEYIAINSIDDQSTASEEKPFGEGVFNALDFLCILGEKLGFSVDRCDNYCTELSYGNGKLVDVYAHADVVPVSKTWKTNPFELIIEGDKMYGRGTADDKGPGLSALFAAKALLDNKLIEGYRVRVIFGGNEELGSRCLEHYFHVLKKEYPTFGFTPDADFPLVYGEKSGSMYIAKYNVDIKGITKFDFGQASNIVLDKCKVNCFLDKDLVRAAVKRYNKQYPEVKVIYDNYQLEFIGKSTHGAHPWEGTNAGLHMLNFVGKLTKNKILTDIFKYYEDGRGKDFKGDFSSQYFTESSYCIGFIKYNSDQLLLYVNMRLPENIDPEVACEQIKNITKCDELELVSKGEALLIDPNSYLVKTLEDVYRSNYYDYKTPLLAIGGGTYAKESKNTIAFGPTLPGEDYKIHEDNEFFLISDYYKCMEVYAEAIYRLGEGCKNEK